MKTCNKCHKPKDTGEFYPAKSTRDGLLGECKECTRARVTKRRNENIEAVRAYDRARGKQKDRIALAKAVTAKWRKEDSRRVAAHNAVAMAIRAGTIFKKPCERCGSEASMAHHESYDRKLDVTWLCQPCHKQRHKELAIEGREP